MHPDGELLLCAVRESIYVYTPVEPYIYKYTYTLVTGGAALQKHKLLQFLEDGLEWRSYAQPMVYSM